MASSCPPRAAASDERGSALHRVSVHGDVALYAVHALFWGAFGVTRMIVALARSGPGAPAPAARRAGSAPFSHAFLVLHMLAFGVMYFGIAQAVRAGRVPVGLPGRRLVGCAIILGGGALVVSALTVFRSWRVCAQVDAGHELATGGPFRYVRHPIYLGFDLLALGSAIWISTPTLWVAVVLMVGGSDLRARAEERLLRATFGEAYEAYRARTRRFVPGVY